MGIAFLKEALAGDRRRDRNGNAGARHHKMIVKIKTSQLLPGMFVHDFNCGWMQHPFFKNRLMIKNRKMIEKVIAHGISEVYIDTEKGLGITVEGDKTEKHAEGTTAPAGAAAGGGLILDTLKERLAKLRKAELGDEIVKGRKIRERAIQVMSSVFADVRGGRPVSLEGPGEVVEDMLESSYRNGNALPCLMKLERMDDYLLSHSMNVCAFMIAFGKAINLDPETIREAGMGALLHDVGKLRVDERILYKEGKLTEEEYGEMKRHVAHTYEILAKSPGISKTALQAAVFHHERFNGSGYPRGLKGERIPKVGQMAGIVDIYDALTSKRGYQERMDPTPAMKKVFNAAAMEELDERLVQSFIQFMGLYPIGSAVRLAGGRIGIVVRQTAESLLKPVVRVVYDMNRGHFIHPRDVDLSDPDNEKGGGGIAGLVDPARFRITPLDYVY